MSRTLFLDEYAPDAIPIDTSHRYMIVVRSLRLELIDCDGESLVGEPYQIYADDTQVASGRLDSEGKARIPAVYKADYYVRFPELQDAAWGRGSLGASADEAVEEEPYTVQQAETLQMILYRERGALDVRPTMSSKANDLLFKVRSPTVLAPGDRVFVPKASERGTKRLSLVPGEVNRFQTTGPARRLRLTLKNRGAALPGVAYTLEVAGMTLEGTADAKGLLDERIPLGATTARLAVNGATRTLVLGGLDPLHTVTGIQARLNNLGFHAGAIDGVIGPVTRRAIRKFQASRSLLVDGIVGPKTREALGRAYGEVT